MGSQTQTIVDVHIGRPEEVSKRLFLGCRPVSAVALGLLRAPIHSSRPGCHSGEAACSMALCFLFYCPRNHVAFEACGSTIEPCFASVGCTPYCLWTGPRGRVKKKTGFFSFGRTCGVFPRQNLGTHRFSLVTQDGTVGRAVKLQDGYTCVCIPY